MTSESPALSVVVACTEAGGTLERCLGALERTCAGMRTEILLVAPLSLPIAGEVETRHSDVRVVRAAGRGLAPDLWAAGFRASRGRIVAFTIEHCVPGPAWAASLVAAVEGGAAGAGGALRLDPATSPVDWAVYLLRYSAFMALPESGPTREIAGDNAAYRRSVLERHASSFEGGFWEVDFHHRIRAEGEHLALVADATTTFAGSDGLRRMLRQRYVHGRHFGALRTGTQRFPVWRSLLQAPLVPAVLAGRILRRTLGRSGHLARALVSLPALLALAGAWALGEAVGAWSARSRGHSQLNHGIGH